MASAKVGRNDPCPCGSGLKYKRCCLNEDTRQSSQRRAIPQAVLKEHEALVRSEREGRQKYGNVRPIIQADWRGKKWIAIGNRVLSSDSWKTFLDFLGDYIKFVLTPDWGKAELTKPLEQRHIIMQWYNGVCEFQRQHIKSPGEVTQFVPNGVVASYYSLAYDLYLLNHHQLLQNELLKRLRHPDQFQGARHELFAAATVIRAGFEIEYQDETDGSCKHPEFMATHPATSQQLAIEAKSRHRSGVLGQAGAGSIEVERAGVRRLIKSAAEKIQNIPFVLFLDVNLPPSDEPVFEIPWVKEVMNALVARADKQHRGKDPFNMVIITNHPHHYGSSDEPDPKKHLLAMFAEDPVVPIAHPEALQLLFEAAEKYGHIPQQFNS